mmetsp:Transcript_12243/g.17961  ORF Transcript_12243/g.17961 Transcript_12243/m.17961 type:complete len:402 (+) Transcript_12243:217-1422(+)|eukprot:CAMPEP_0194201318 /NCGR_PEP_ID=MMETSP0156-20130528/1604_1 /TAXON_ID=33649 /ORGANISM="Thalassionema nitzschioides, Strain L26-B" /LENGTH=401 /DNA_ID=CAMNT_0038926473 /DNA_START=246 /DNA_END=1451 /DNA_ORIENTATION=+
MTTTTIIQRLLEDTTQEQQDGGALPHLLASILSNLFLFVLIFGLSVTVPVNKLKHQLSNGYAVGTGIVLQFGIMPALGFVAVLLGKFSFPMGLALLVVTSSPGGSYSNWWCSIFNADLALSVAMTAISTILSIGLLPANLFLYSHLTYHDQGDGVLDALDFGSLFLSLGIVIGAIVSGLLVSWRLGSRKGKRIRKWASRGANLSGLALIVFSAVLSSIGGENEDSEDSAKLWSQEWTFYVLVAFPCLIGMTLSNVLGKYLFRLSKPECVTIAIECAYQNVGIAVSMAVTLFKDPTERSQALVVPLYYGLVEAVLIGIYCVVAWKAGWTKAPPSDSICQVLSQNYEVDEDDSDDEKIIIDEEQGEEDDFLGSLNDDRKEQVTTNRNRLASEDTVTTDFEMEC